MTRLPVVDFRHQYVNASERPSPRDQRPQLGDPGTTLGVNTHESGVEYTS